MFRVLVAAIVFFCGVGPASAEEHFFPNGFFVGLDVRANVMHREKKINYGSWGLIPPAHGIGIMRGLAPVSATNVRDVAPAPSLSLGYKLTNTDSIQIRGTFVRYSAERNLTNTGSSGCGFGVTVIDGSFHLGSCTLPASAAIAWKSTVGTGDFEYQRLLGSSNLGDALALVGFQYRYERQNFDAEGGFPAASGGLGPVVPSAVRLDLLSEKLTEHLYGPYAGIKLALKPSKDSNFSFNAKTAAGYLFKTASFRGREIFDPDNFIGFLEPIPPIRRNDKASIGTVFSTVGLGVVYTIVPNLNAELDYHFNWINKAAHIINPQTDLRPAKIGSSAILEHRIGLGLTFVF